MPNWCSNSMVVYGNPTEVKDFYSKLKNAWKRGDETKHWHLYEIYVEFGYDEKFILNGEENNGYNRGYFIDIESDISTLENGQSYFKLWYDSAWSSMYEGFDWLLEKYYKDLHQVTLAEECGCEIYINTDVKGLFFKEKYVVDVIDYDIYYCESGAELVKTINMFAKKSQQSESAQDCLDLLKREDNVLGKYQIEVHEFSRD